MTCLHCGAGFTPKNAQQRFCGLDCYYASNRARRENGRAERQARLLEIYRALRLMKVRRKTIASRMFVEVRTLDNWMHDKKKPIPVDKLERLEVVYNKIMGDLCEKK